MFNLLVSLYKKIDHTCNNFLRISMEEMEKIVLVKFLCPKKEED